MAWLECNISKTATVFLDSILRPSIDDELITFSSCVYSKKAIAEQITEGRIATMSSTSTKRHIAMLETLPQWQSCSALLFWTPRRKRDKRCIKACGTVIKRLNDYLEHDVFDTRSYASVQVLHCLFIYASCHNALTRLEQTQLHHNHRIPNVPPLQRHPRRMATRRRQSRLMVHNHVLPIHNRRLHMDSPASADPRRQKTTPTS
jgi:hypothetical protein